MVHTFAKAVIVGCGLIGGSLALSLREQQRVQELVAVDPDPFCREQAVTRGVVDRCFSNLREAVPGADLIVFATPVRKTCDLLGELAGLDLVPGCIVTDAGSTKGEICREARRVLPPSVHFIGGHPMAGSEKSGVRAASNRLFENAIYVLTPFADTDKDAYEKWSSAVQAIKAQVLVLEPDLHDRVVAAISHVPHIIAAQLVDQVADLSRKDSEGHLFTKLAAGGFRDVTRVASGNPQMWRDIVLSNRSSIFALLEDWKRGLNRFLEMMGDETGGEIEEFFGGAAEFRDALPAKSRGAMRSVYEVTIDVVDEPGVIGKITTLIGLHGINMNSVRLIESREEDNGQLLLSFRSRSEMEAGSHVLLVNGFCVYFRD